MTTPDINVQDVTDPDDPRLDDFRDLNSVDRRPDLPSGKGLVIAEGVLVVQRMLASRFTPVRCSEPTAGSPSSGTISRAPRRRITGHRPR